MGTTLPPLGDCLNYRIFLDSVQGFYMHIQMALVTFSGTSQDKRCVHGWRQAYPKAQPVPRNISISEKYLIPYNQSHNARGSWHSLTNEGAFHLGCWGNMEASELGAWDWGQNEMSSLNAGSGKRRQAAESWVRCGEEQEHGCYCVAGSTQVVTTAGEPFENSVQVWKCQ